MKEMISSPFPASSSILAGTALNQFLQAAYHLSSASSCNLIKAGINHTYLVRDGAATFVFRVYSFNWRTEQEILEEIRLLHHLQQHGVPVSFAIADQQQQYIQTLPAVEGPRYGVLFSYAPGEKIIDLSGETHGKIGAIIARMHQHTRDFPLARVNYTPEVLIDHTLVGLERFLPLDSPEMMFMVAAHQYLTEAYKGINKDQLRTGAVHLDIWFDNLNIDRQQEVTIFDFDFCGNGWLCTDIAYYLLQLYALETDVKEYYSKRDSFLEGYSSIVEISDEEKRLLPIIGASLYFFYFGVQCRRYDDWSNVFLNEAYLKRYITLRVKKFMDFHELGRG